MKAFLPLLPNAQCSSQMCYDALQGVHWAFHSFGQCDGVSTQLLQEAGARKGLDVQEVYLLGDMPVWIKRRELEVEWGTSACNADPVPVKRKGEGRRAVGEAPTTAVPRIQPGHRRGKSLSQGCSLRRVTCPALFLSLQAQPLTGSSWGH